MVDYKYIATDLDGTLLNDAGEVDIDAIRLIDLLIDEGKIQRFIIASGRHFRDLSDILQKIQHRNEVIAICGDGQYIYDGFGKVILSLDRYVSSSLPAKIIGMENVRGISIITDKSDYIMTPSIIKKIVYLAFRRFRGGHSSGIVSKKGVAVISKIEKLILTLREQGHRFEIDEDYYVHHLKSGVVEVLAVNKMMALRELEKLSLITLSETVYFGDDDNDIECFKSETESIAVDNASQSIREIADDITFDNNSHGVYLWLKENMYN